jgi:hypothetical protein
VDARTESKASFTSKAVALDNTDEYLAKISFDIGPFDKRPRYSIKIAQRSLSADISSIALQPPSLEILHPDILITFTIQCPQYVLFVVYFVFLHRRNSITSSEGSSLKAVRAIRLDSV